MAHQEERAFAMYFALDDLETTKAGAEAFARMIAMAEARKVLWELKACDDPSWRACDLILYGTTKQLDAIERQVNWSSYWRSLEDEEHDTVRR